MNILEKIFNFVHMTGIGNKYKSCAGDIDEAAKKLEQLEQHINANYVGQANAVVADIIKTLHEHMMLLKSCHTGAAQFVEYTGKEMRNWDETSGR